MATDLVGTSANTASPVVSSASYTFVAGDVGHYLFIKSGTNWTPGWYPIASVSGGAATLNASAGSIGLYTSGIGFAGSNTAAGCATTASPTGGTWSVDYSQADSARLTFTDMVIDATTNTKFTSALNPVGPNFVGNLITVTSGTGFTVQGVSVNSVAGTTATCDKSLGTLSSTGGNGKLGGALASPGQAASLATITGHTVWAAGSHSIGNGTANTSGNKVNITTATNWRGYGTTRGDGGRATLNAGAASMTPFTHSGSSVVIENFNLLNPSSFASVVGFVISSNFSVVRNLKASVTGLGFNFSSTGTRHINCEANTCAGGGFQVNGSIILERCVARSCTGTGFVNPAGTFVVQSRCLAANNSNAGFNTGSSATGILIDCTSVGNTGGSGYGFKIDGRSELINCLAASNAALGFFSNVSGGSEGFRMTNCAGWSNTSGNYDSANWIATAVVGFVGLTADPFVDSASGNYTLNAAGGLTARGVASTLPGLTGSSYRDIGAYQHAESRTPPVDGGPVH